MALTQAELLIIAKARDEASAVLNSVGENVKKTGGLFDGLGGSIAKIGVGIFAIKQVGDAVAGMVGGLMEDAINAQSIAKATDAVVASTKGVAGMSADAVAELASSLSKVAPFEDEAIQGAENMLLTFTNIGKDIFPDATEAVLNMSQALGQDLKSSSIQLGKALQDPITGASALRRVGVALTDQQEEQIKKFMAVNDLASAQGVILKELSTEFGGAARAAGETFAGKMTILQTQIGNVKEAIGGPLIGILGSLMTKLTPLVTAFGEWLPGAIDDFMNAISPGIKVVGDFMGAVGELGGRALDKLREWAPYAQAAFELVQEGLGGLVDAFSGGFSAIWEIVSSVGQMIYEALQWLNPFAAHSQPLVDAVDQGVNDIIASYNKVGAVKVTLEDLGQSVEGVNDAIIKQGSSLDEAKTAVAGYKGRLDDAKAAVDAYKDKVADSKSVVDGLTKALKDQDTIIKGLSGTQIKGTKEYTDKLFALEQETNRVQLTLNKMKMAGASKDAMKPLEDQLTQLGLQADNLNLEQKLNFDPLKQQIKDLASPTQELPFAEIMQGIRDAQAAQKTLETQLGPATALYEQQSAALDAAQSQLKLMESAAKAADSQLKAMGSAAGAAKGAGGAMAGAATATAGFKTQMDEIKKPLEDAKAQMEEWRGKIDSAKASIKDFAAPFQEQSGIIGNILKTTLKGDFTALGPMFQAWLGEAWSKINWADVLTVVYPLALAFEVWLGKGDIGKPIHDWLLATWQKIDWSGIFAQVGHWTDQLSAWIAATDWDSLGRDTGKFIVQMVRNGIDALTQALSGTGGGGIDWGAVWTAFETAMVKTFQVSAAIGKAIVQFAWALASELAKALGPAIAGAVNDVIKANYGLDIGGAAKALGDVIGGKPSMTDAYKGYASGGIVPGAIGRPQLAVVHGGETVIPVGGNTSTSLTFAMNGVSFNDRSDIDYFIQQASAKIGGRSNVQSRFGGLGA